MIEQDLHEQRLETDQAACASRAAPEPERLSLPGLRLLKAITWRDCSPAAGKLCESESWRPDHGTPEPSGPAPDARERRGRPGPFSPASACGEITRPSCAEIEDADRRTCASCKRRPAEGIDAPVRPVSAPWRPGSGPRNCGRLASGSRESSGERVTAPMDRSGRLRLGLPIR